MSKASEWAEHVKDRNRPRFGSARIEAECNDHGHLARVEVDTEAIPPDEALAFGVWIIDTFSDEPASPTSPSAAR